MLLRRCLAALILLAPLAGHAGVLAEDRADIMYHRYSGGGVTVDGPSVLVRKKFGESFAATANYYVDAISSASIDVVTTASPYKERREQKSLSVEYLHGKSTYSAGYITSKENDYDANTVFASVSQDMFGDLTTVTLGYSQGKDTIGKRGEPDFQMPLTRRNYRVGVTQILTRNMLLSLNYEATTEQGYLQNPYRTMRYAGPSPGSYTRAAETYPGTRTGTAGSASLKYYLPWRAAVQGMYRFYSDTWGIVASTAEVEYTHPLGRRLVLNGSYRFHTQTSADFYSDLFPRADYQNFMARDKNYASLTAQAIGVGAAYEFPVTWMSWLKKGTANLQYHHMLTNYHDFTDLRDFPPGSAVPGTEPNYTLNADVYQLFVSFWF
jgi:Protein of unknown function (DUF3570)